MDIDDYYKEENDTSTDVTMIDNQQSKYMYDRYGNSYLNSISYEEINTLVTGWLKQESKHVILIYNDSIAWNAKGYCAIIDEITGYINEHISIECKISIFNDYYKNNKVWDAGYNGKNIIEIYNKAVNVVRSPISIKDRPDLKNKKISDGYKEIWIEPVSGSKYKYDYTSNEQQNLRANCHLYLALYMGSEYSEELSRSELSMDDIACHGEIHIKILNRERKLVFKHTITENYGYYFTNNLKWHPNQYNDEYFTKYKIVTLPNQEPVQFYIETGYFLCLQIPAHQILQYTQGYSSDTIAYDAKNWDS